MVVVVVGPIVEHHSLRGSAVPDVNVEWEKAYGAACSSAHPMSEIMLADLPVVVRQTLRIGVRLREQEETRVFVGIRREKHDPRRLEMLLAVAQTVDSGDLTVAAGGDASHVGAIEDRQVLCLDRFGDGSHRGRVFRVNVATAAAAIAMKDAGWPSTIYPRVDRGGRPEGFPAE